MNNIPNNIKKMLDKGEAFTFEEVLEEDFTKKDREEIDQIAAELMAAMELRKLRERKKLTQSQLAKKMGVKREFISRIESAKQNVTIATLHKIAKATGTKFKFGFK